MVPPIVTSSSPCIGTFINTLCGQNTIDTTVIVACCSKSYFIEQLLIHANPADNPTQPAEDYGRSTENLHQAPITETDAGTENIETSTSQPKFRLTLPILRTLAISSRTKLIFCPSIPSFRGYVSTLPARLGPEDGPSPNVVLIDMLALHHGTSEFTVQGLSRTFAMLASVSAVLPRGMRLVECVESQSSSSSPSSDRGARLWKAEVPLLSGSVKIGQAGQGWAVRTISIEKFAVRWFDFEEGQKK